MELRHRDELVLEIGTRILDDADKLRAFMPEFTATFPFVWCGSTYRVTIEMTNDQEEI